MDKYFLLKNILVDDIINNVINFEFNINNSITTNNLYVFKLLIDNIEKKDIMSWFILAIKFDSYDIINYIIDNYYENINYMYNGYPLEYYSSNKEIIKKIRHIKNNNIDENIKYTKTLKNGIKEFFSNEIIENDLIGISEIAFKKDNIDIIDILSLIFHHRHRIFFVTEISYIYEEIFGIKKQESIILIILENFDLYFLSKFSNNNNLLRIFICKFNFKENNNYLKVYENHDDNLLPIVEEMTFNNFFIRCIEIINQKKYLAINTDLLCTMYIKYENLFVIMIKKLDIEVNKLIIYIQLIYENLVKNIDVIYSHKDNINKNEIKSVKFEIGKNRYFIDYDDFLCYDYDYIYKNIYTVDHEKIMHYDAIDCYELYRNKNDIISTLKKIEKKLENIF